MRDGSGSGSRRGVAGGGTTTASAADASSSWLYASEMEQGCSPMAARSDGSVGSSGGGGGSLSGKGHSSSGGGGAGGGDDDRGRGRPASPPLPHTQPHHAVGADDLRWGGLSAALNSSWTENTKALRSGELADLETSLVRLASETYFDEDFSSSVFYWKRAEFVAQCRKADRVAVALLSSNVGAALHHLGRFDEAVERYTFTCDELERNRPGRLSSLISGDVTEHRIAFLQHRMRLARKGERPRVGEYLSGNGELKMDGKENWRRSLAREEERKHMDKILDATPF